MSEQAATGQNPNGALAGVEFTMAVDVDGPYAETIARVRSLLGEAGFGVLTEIDLAATLKAKLDVDVAPRLILGACRPQLAHRALQADPRVAAILPCNVVVSSLDEAHSRVEVLDPALMSAISADPGLAEVVADGRARLRTMLDSLAG